jgi:hypothetical protein
MRKTLFSLFLMAAGTTYATTLPITSGVADLSGGLESFSLSGPGFSYSGSGVNSEFLCGPLISCIPGARIPSGNAGLSSADRGVFGGISVGSASFGFLELENSPGAAEIDFQFNMTTPGTNPPSSLILTGPFTGEAFFEDPRFLSGELFFFQGQGVATINLNLVTLIVPYGVQQMYELQNIHFDFGAPEPGTGTLLCVAGAVLWGFRRFRDVREKRSTVS